MSKLTDMLKPKVDQTRKSNKFSSMLGVMPSKERGIFDTEEQRIQKLGQSTDERNRAALADMPFTPKFGGERSTDIAADALAVGELIAKGQKERVATTDEKGDIVLDLSKFESKTPQEKEVEKFLQERDFINAQNKEKEEFNARKAREAQEEKDKFINQPIVSAVAGTMLGRALGLAPSASKSETEFKAGLASSIPFVGDKLKGSLSALQEQTGSRRESVNLPILGETDVSFGSAGNVAGNIIGTGVQYGAVGKALKGLGSTSKLAQLVGKNKITQFAGEQVADLFLDTVIQTPQEVFRAIDEDLTLDEFGSQWFKARAFDAAFNAVIGGAMTVAQLRSLSKQAKANKEAFEQSLKKLTPEQRAFIQKELGVEVPLSPGLRGIDDAITKQDVGPLKTDATSTIPGPSKVEVKMPDGTSRFVEVPSGVSPRANLAQDSLKTFDTPSKKFNSMLTNQDGTFRSIDNIGSPRTPDFKTPEVGTSQSPLLQRVKEGILGDPNVRALQKEMKRIDTELPTTSNLARTEAAERIVRDNFEEALKLVKQGEQFGSRIESEVARKLLPTLSEQGRYKDYVDVVDAVMKKGRASGQDVQGMSLWSDISPEGASKWALDTLTEAGVKYDPKVIDNIRQDFEAIGTASKQDLVDNIVKRVNPKNSKIKNALLGNLEKNVDTLGFAKMQEVNRAIAMEKITKLIPKASAKKISSIQAISHLLNTRTFVRNIVGNTASITGEMVSRPLAALADVGLKAYSGNRTVVNAMPKFQKAFKEGWNAGKENFFEIVSSPVNKQLTSKYEKLFESAFNSKAGKGLEKLLQVSLQTPDEFFKAFVKTDSLFNQVQARLGKDVKNWDFEKVLKAADNSEIETALKEAEFATFQNDSRIADVMTKTKALLNQGSAMLPVPFFSKDFGLGDMTLKYTRVPGNIITRGFEYSPFGTAKALADFGKIATSGAELTPQLQRQLSLAIGRGLTGTGVMALGGILTKNNIITKTETGSDYNKQAFDKAQGLGSYKINFDALGRLIKGEDSTPQEGDSLRSFNFLQPFNVALAVGSRIAEEGGFKDANIEDLGMATWEEAVDLPTMFIVKKMMYEGMDKENTIADVLSVPFKEAIPGFVPSTSRQIAQLVDPTIRETRYGAQVDDFNIGGVNVGKGLESALNVFGEEVGGKIQANIPGLSKQLKPKLDVFGEEQKRESELFGSRIAGGLFDPGFETKFTPKEYNDKIQLVAELSNKTNFFPDRKPPTGTSLDGIEYQLTPEEQQRWQEVESKALDQFYKDFFNTVTEEQINLYPDEIAKNLSELKGYASESAKMDFIQRRE